VRGSVSYEDYAPDDGMNQVGITGVFLPLIFWCLKMGENGGFGMLHLVGFNTSVLITHIHRHHTQHIADQMLLPHHPLFLLRGMGQV
jgi:hypothetical protein